MNAAAMASLFRRVDSFCERTVDSEFVRELEETSPAFEAAYPIHQNRQKIRRIRVILLTNAVLAVRKKVVEAGKTIGLPVAYNVLDFARYTDILKSRGNAEPIEIDVTSINGTPLPCLQAHVHGTSYKSYLVVLPRNVSCRHLRSLRRSVAGTERQGVPAGADESEQRHYRYCPGNRRTCSSPTTTG